MDQSHPLVVWLKGQDPARNASWLAKELGKRSPATVSRWIRGERYPDPIDQERIAQITKGADGVPAVPVSFWHTQALKSAGASTQEAAAA